jgi:hypothetical protein
VKRLQWCRSKVQEFTSQGYNQLEIFKILQISQPTINGDFSYLRQQAITNIKRYIDERLPEEYEKCMVGLNAILKEAWNTSLQARQEREKIQTLSLAKECYSMKLDLLSNAAVVDEVIRFVSSKTEEKIKSSASNSNEDNKESNEPDYDEDEDQLEEEQEDETGETNTINHTF